MQTYKDNDNKFTLLRKILQNQSTSQSSIESLLAAMQPSISGISCGPDIVVAAAGTPVQGASIPTNRGVLVIARLSNVGLIYAGGPNVTNGLGSYRGLILGQLGMPPTILPVSNLDQVWINADNNGDAAGVIIL